MKEYTEDGRRIKVFVGPDSVFTVKCKGDKNCMFCKNCESWVDVDSNIYILNCNLSISHINKYNIDGRCKDFVDEEDVFKQNVKIFNGCIS